MTGTFTIIGERIESFMGKRGKIENLIVALLDNDPKHPMLNTVDYVLNPDEREKHGGKLRGKKLEIGIAGASVAFGGRLRLQGQILKLD